jgi:hypothetical protein
VNERERERERETEAQRKKEMNRQRERQIFCWTLKERERITWERLVGKRDIKRREN